MSLVPFMANEFYCPLFFFPEKHRLNELMIQKLAFKVQIKHLIVNMVVYIAVSRRFIKLSRDGLPKDSPTKGQRTPYYHSLSPFDSEKGQRFLS